MIRILIGAASEETRDLLAGMFDGDLGVVVVARAATGGEAVALTAKFRPEVVVLDAELSRADVAETTRELMVRTPVPIVVVAASAAPEQLPVVRAALEAGAVLAVGRVTSKEDERYTARCQELRAMARAMSSVKVVRRWETRPAWQRPTARPERAAASGDTRVRLVAIAASTGGPAALRQVLSSLSPEMPAAVLVVQHIATGFIGGLVKWLGSLCDVPVDVAREGEPLHGGRVYFAPDDRHLGVRPDGTVELSLARPIGGFRPSATYLFESVAHAYGPAVLAVMLTGMGNDGVAGLHAVHAAGGRILAQDEDSSVVYGMPQEAIRAGIVDEVLSIQALGRRVAELVTGGGHAEQHLSR